MLEEISSQIASLQKEISQSMVDEHTLWIDAVEKTRVDAKKIAVFEASKIAGVIQRSTDDSLLDVGLFSVVT